MTSVVVKSLDEHAIRKAPDAWAARLFEQHPEIEEIVVFGSFAEDGGSSAAPRAASI